MGIEFLLLIFFPKLAVIKGIIKKLGKIKSILLKIKIPHKIKGNTNNLIKTCIKE